MGSEHLDIYLNDHLAGSVAGIELLEQLEEDHRGAPLQNFFAELRTEISADREQLKALMAKLEIEESSTRKASAWFAEKITELKLRVDDSTKGPLRLLQSVEILELGVEGKRLLWRVLMAAAEQSPSLQILDYARLEQRAEEQRRKIEAVRLEAGRKALVAERSRSA